MASILARYTAQFPHHLGSQASWLAAPSDGSHPAGYACVGLATPFRHTPPYPPPPTTQTNGLQDMPHCDFLNVSSCPIHLVHELRPFGFPPRPARCIPKSAAWPTAHQRENQALASAARSRVRPLSPKDY